MRKGIVLSLLCAVLYIGCSRSKNAAPAGDGTSPEAPGRVAAAADSRPVIVALGDSLTAGLGVPPSQNYPAKLQQKIDAEGYHYRVVNEGVSGDTSAQGLNRLSAVRELHPRIVILELGANDGLRGLPPVETRTNLEAIINQMREDGADVVLAGMEVPPNYGVEFTRSFHRVFPDLAARYHASLIPFFLEGVAGQPDLNQDDGIHPTAKGYDIVVENVWRVLRPLLR